MDDEVPDPERPLGRPQDSKVARRGMAMRRGHTLAVVCSLLTAAFSFPRSLPAQTCQDDEAMVENYRKDLMELVDKTRKESLEDFQKAFHQKICLTKLTLSLGLTQELVDCLDKATQDPTASKEQTDQYKAKRESYAKLHDKIEQDHKTLKGAEAPKDAKALMAKFDFSP